MRKDGYRNAIRKSVNDGILNQEDANLLEAFISEVSAQRNVTNERKYNLSRSCIIIRQFTPPFNACKTEDILKAVEKYRDTTEHNGSTKNQRISAFKQFAIWLIETENNTNLNEKRIGKIKVKNESDRLTEKGIMIGDELERMYKACKSPRDRLLFEVLYESGGRINEVLTLQWSDIEFTDNYATVSLESKTDKPRIATLALSCSRLKQWKDQYPTGADGDKFVFYGRASTTDKPMTYMNVTKILQAALQSAGITKNITAHSFRHTRITDLLRDGLSHTDICMQMWGTPTSDMLKVYAHLVPQDTVNNMLRHLGIEPKGRKTNPLPDAATPIQCEKCGIVNPKTNNFCSGCGKILTEEAETIYEETLRLIEQHPEFQRAMNAALLSLKLNQGEA